LTATGMPAPLLAGLMVFSSTQPLCTRPNPPSPRRVSDLKFRVAALSSANVKIRRLGASRILPSRLGLASLPPFVEPPATGRVVPLPLLEVVGAVGDFRGFPGELIAAAACALGWGATMPGLAIAAARVK
jgi:hypothetical protein